MLSEDVAAKDQRRGAHEQQAHVAPTKKDRLVKRGSAAVMLLHLKRKSLSILDRKSTSGITPVTYDTIHYRGRDISLLARRCSISDIDQTGFIGGRARA
jgi:hypothetical protein